MRKPNDQYLLSLRNLATDIRLALFDIDGTLIGANGHYSVATTNAIRALQEQGIATAIASGRPHYATAFVSKTLGLDSLGCFFAGGLLYEPQSDRVLQSQYLIGDLNKLLHAVKEAGLYCEVYTDSDYWIEAPSEIYNAHSKVLRVAAKQGSLVRIVEQSNVVKLLVGVNTRTMDLVNNPLYELEKVFTGYQFAYAKMASHPDWIFASIISCHASRADAFQMLCQDYGIQPAQVIAFGDAQSDQVFIESAGIGVAMGDAPLSVQASANLVTATVAQDGVATAIKYLFQA